MPSTPTPPPGGDHLLISIAGGDWQTAAATGSIPIALPEPILPARTQLIPLAIYNPSDETITLTTSTTIGDALPITAPELSVTAPATVAARSVATGEIRIVTPSWADEPWMGQRIEAHITIDAVGGSEPASLASTGIDALSAGALAAALLLLGALMSGIGRRHRVGASGSPA